MESGLTAKEYAGEAGLNVNSLGHWKWKLSAEARRAAPREQRAGAPPVVEVKLGPRAADPDRHEDAGRFEVVLPGGATVRVPPRFDGAALRELVRALEAR